MPGAGRITGRVSEDGTTYELLQFGGVRSRIPIAEAHADEKLKRAIEKNGWGPLP